MDVAQQALYDTLAADTTLMGLIGSRLYDRPPDNTVYPFIEIGEKDENLSAMGGWTHKTRGYRCYVRFNVVTKPGGLGSTQGTDIAARVRTLLDVKKLSMPAGYTMVMCSLDNQFTSRDTDKDLIALRYEVRYYETAAHSTNPLIPGILSLSPADGAITVDASPTLVIGWDKAVTAVAGKTVSLYNYATDVVVEAMSVTGASVTVSGSTATITLSATPLDGLTGYYVLLDDGAFASAADGTLSAAISSKDMWNWSTLDTSYPTIVSLSPADGSVSSSDTTLTIVYSEDVTVVAGKNYYIYDSSDTLLQTISATGADVTASGVTVTITPPSVLPYGGDVYITADAGAVEGSGSRAALSIDKGDWDLTITDVGLVLELDAASNPYINDITLRDESAYGNHPTIYNFGGTADSGTLLPVQDDGLLSLANLLGETGNFATDSNSDGLADGMFGAYATATLAANVQSFTTASSFRFIGFSNLSWDPGHTYYICVYAKSSGSTWALSANTGGSSGSINPSSDFIFASLRITSLGVNPLFLVYGPPNSTPTTVDVKLAAQLDLTAIFGAGNEPSQATLNRWIRMHYESGGRYINATPLSGSEVRYCIRTDGADDFGRVLSPSAGLDITNEQFALCGIIRQNALSAGAINTRNGSTAGDIQYGAYLTGAGALDFYLNGASRLSAASALTAETWVAFILHRDAAGNLSAIINGTSGAAGSYATALVTAANQMLSARSSAADASTQTDYCKAYVGALSIHSGESATVANCNAYLSSLATRYGITYAT